MTFDITDKYYTSGQLDLDDLTIKMQNGQVDSNGNAIVYDLETLENQRKVKIAFNAVPYYAEPNIKVTNSDTGEVETITTVDTHQIGHTYTLTISNLEKFEIETGLTTANYSGIITVDIEADKIAAGPNANVEHLKKRYEVAYINDKGRYEIKQKNVNKASSVKQLLPSGCEDVFVFGNDENDICLFQTFPNSYVMENSTDTVKRCAKNTIFTSKGESVLSKILQIIGLEE